MKILVVHPAQQHSYHLAAALSKKGWLYKYGTTVYQKKGSFTHLVSLLLRGKYRKKAQARVCEALDPKDVVQFCELEGLLKLLAMNTAFFRPYYKRIKYRTADHFAKKAAHYAIRHKVDAVICYDDCSSLLFELLKERAPHTLRIMDVSAANILYMRQIYDRDMNLQPAFARRLRREREIVWCEENIARAEKELTNAQLFLVPSRFVARSLQFSGVSGDRIRLCPYGVDVARFPQKAYRAFEKPLQRPVRFIYVGGVKELKGIGYLLQAISQLPKCQAELTVVGQCDERDADVKPYLDRVMFTGSVLHTQVAELLMDADVFILPSLGEGMSLAALEAAACGLPLIITENSGINDAITEGREGFVVPIQSTEALVEKMRWFIHNTHRIEPMGRAARSMALRYTWDSYDRRIDQLFDEIGNMKWEG